MRYTTRNLESGQASIRCDPQTAYNRLATLEDWWELIESRGTLEPTIVMCKECIHCFEFSLDKGSYGCRAWCMDTRLDGYCHKGERKC